MKHRSRDLGQWITEWLEDHEMSANEAAQNAGYMTNSPLSKVINGEKKVPLDRLDDFARGLRIREPEDKAHFKLLCELGWSTPRMRAAHWEMVDRIATLEASHVSMREKAALLAKRIADLEAVVQAREDEIKRLRRTGS